MSAVILGSDRVLAPGRWRWLRSVAWAVGLFVLVTVAGTLAAAAVGLIGSAATGIPLTVALTPATHVGQIAYVAMVAATLAAYAGLVCVGEARRPSELAPARAAVELAAGVAIGTAMMAVTVALLLAARGVTLTTQPIRSLGNAVALSLQSGFVEEVLFRLIVLRLLWRAFGPWPALALSALLFGAVHLMNPNATWFAAFAIAIEAGIMLAAFYILTGRLWVSIGVHAAWNFTQGWVFGAAVSGTNGFAGGPLALDPVPGAPQWLSGGAFGPEASFAGLLVGTLVGAGVLVLAARRGAFAPEAAVLHEATKEGTAAAPGA
jgi:membrane protease YdiL (CAAX protease family)